MKLAIISPPLWTAVLCCCFVFALFALRIYLRFKKVSRTIKNLQLRIDQSKITDHLYMTEILPIIMKMHNPFSLRKPTIENYFSQEFINNYLHRKTKEKKCLCDYPDSQYFTDFCRACGELLDV